MNTMGIVRKMDKLGRVVIPYEVRKIYNLQEGDALEILPDGNGSVTIRKFSVEEQLEDGLNSIRNMLDEFGGKMPRDVANALYEHMGRMDDLLAEWGRGA